VMDLIVKNLEIKELKLIRVDFDIPQKVLNEKLFDNMTKEEQIWSYKLLLTIPNLSSEEKDDGVWDIILVDNYLFDSVEYILEKYKIPYNISDITENYYHRDILIEETLSISIDKYLEEYLTVDIVLDRINEVGITNINKFELSFLERFQKMI
jgi:hypothetical protein